MFFRFRRQLGAVALGLTALSAGRHTFAQLPTSHAEDAELTPPTLLESVRPTYPEAARAKGLQAKVDLKLSLDENGAVTQVEVLEPAGDGFDEAAVEAALRLRFAPARRGATPIPARIRYVFVFEPPPEAGPPPEAAVPPEAAPGPELSAAPESSTPSEAPPSEATKADVVDVNVRGRLSALEQLQQSADAVNVLDLKRARTQSADMGEVLARSQGVVVRRSGGLGSSERFSLNGLYDQQIRFFLDGVPLSITGYTFGVTSIPVNFIEHVEIYRGVVPIRLGADALGGAVNFVTAQQYRTHAAASYQVSSFGTHRVTVGGRYRHAPTGLVAGAEGFLDVAKNDYPIDVEVPDERGQLSPARVRRFHDAYRAGGGSLEVGVVEKPWAKRLLLRGFYGTTAKELQHNAVMRVPYGEVHYTTANYGAIGRYEVEPRSDVALELALAYSKRTIHFVDTSPWVYNWRGERVRERRVAGEIDARPSDRFHWEHSGFGRLNARWELRPGHRLSLSSSTSYATRSGDERRQADATARDPLEAERRLLTLVSGLEYQARLFDERLENVLFVKDYVYRATSEEPLPAGVLKERDVSTHRQGVGNALRFRFWPWLYAKASYEYATRLPSSEELFGDGVLVRPNLDLAPEVSHNVNVGPRVEVKRSRAGDFVVEVNAFLRDSARLIVLLGDDRSYAYQNVYHARSKGLESLADWTSPGRYLNLYAALTWIDQRNASSNGTFGAFEGDRIPNRPYLTSSWGSRLRLTGFPGKDDALEPYYHGRYLHAFYRGWESQGLREHKQVVDAQLLHTLGLSWSLSEEYGRFTSTFEVSNVTGAKAFDNFGVEKPGRAYHFKVVGEL